MSGQIGFKLLSSLGGSCITLAIVTASLAQGSSGTPVSDRQAASLVGGDPSYNPNGGQDCSSLNTPVADPPNTPGYDCSILNAGVACYTCTVATGTRTVDTTTTVRGGYYQTAANQCGNLLKGTCQNVNSDNFCGGTTAVTNSDGSPKTCQQVLPIYTQQVLSGG